MSFKRSYRAKISKILFNLVILFFLFDQVLGFSSSSDKNRTKKYQNFCNNCFNLDSIRSPADKNIYHIYKLSNGLEVLIVQDKNARQTAAGMTVNSGITKEGIVNGLAHFTEHMLFLGSEEYPTPTKFVDYITQYSGVFNGYTDFDITAFYFTIHPDNFKKGVDIFSRFFIDPLFDPQLIKEEVNSVNSEFERNIQVDYKRKEQVFRDIANEKSHFHRFTTGNNQTLLEFTEKNGLDLREEVIQYYTKNYRPDNMKLIIYGHKDVDYYKKIVKKSFSDMKVKEKDYVEKNITEKSFSEMNVTETHYEEKVKIEKSFSGMKAPENPDVEKDKIEKSFSEMNVTESPNVEKNKTELPFTPFKEGKFVIYKSISNHQQLEISFIIPDIFTSLPHNIGLYIKTLLNYKGRGSLVDILIQEGLGSYLHGALRKTYQGWSIFKIKASLTKKGIIEIPKVLLIIFKYIEFIKKLSQTKKIYNHIKRYHDLKFLFTRKSHRPISFVSSMCMAFLKYSKKDLFTQHNLLYLYDYIKISEFANHLSLKNSIILLGNHKFNKKLTKHFKLMIDNFEYDEKFKSEDPWYKTQYTKFSISDSFIKGIEKDKVSSEDLGFSENFSFLKKKKKIINFSLLKSCPSKKRKNCIKKFRKDSEDLTPKKLDKNENFELWHKKDRSYLVSRINFFTKFVFESKNYMKDSKKSILMKLHNYCLINELRNYMYAQRRKRNYFYVLPKIKYDLLLNLVVSL
jgi:secreted Zn-dependent insulinase-like peptidase